MFEWKSFAEWTAWRERLPRNHSINVRVADNSPEGARELLETPYVDYFARLNAMTAQLEPAAEIHWS